MARDHTLLATVRSEADGAAFAAPGGHGEERNLKHVLWTLWESKFLIVAIAAAIIGLGVLYVLAASPIYRTDVVIQVERPQRAVTGTADLSAVFGDQIPSETEMEIVRSRTLLRTVVDQLKLDTTITPVRFPVIGGAMARRHKQRTPAPAPLAFLEGYAWGGERVTIQRLVVPEALLGLPLTLTALDGGGWELRGPEGWAVRGSVGKVAAAERDGERLEVFVSDLVARPKTRFTVVRSSQARVVEQLQEILRINEKGRHTGILVVALDSPEPRRAAAILDAVAAAYLRQNVEQKSAEAAKTLEFLESQLPTLKANVDAAESRLNNFQVKRGTVDLSHETQALLARSGDVERTLSETELQRAELRQKFTENHPQIISLNEKIAQLRAAQNTVNTRMRELPATELDAGRLGRDVKVASELYVLLLNRAQELRVAKSGTIGNVRILDRATVPDRPIRPKKTVVLLVAGFLGIALGTGAAFARRSLRAGVDDPDAVEQLTGLPIYAVVPRSAGQAGLARTAPDGGPGILAAVDPSDPAVESLRSLRTSLQFSLVESRSKVIVVTGPTAEVGKSFVTANLAHVLAASGRRVLLVDGDLRRGRLHRVFGQERQHGLSEAIAGSLPVAQAIRKTRVEHLDLVSTGRIPPNPSELLGSDRFERLLAELSAPYDLVLVDSPPILPVTDAALVARHAAVTLMVLKAGAHSARDIGAAVKRLGVNGVRVQGIVFNDSVGVTRRYGYRYKYTSAA